MDASLRIGAAVLLHAAWLLTARSSAAQWAGPLETQPERVGYNLQSTNGVPLSSTRGNPSGSDGRAPTSVQQEADGLTTAVPTAKQFQGGVLFGGVAAPRPVRLVGGTPLTGSEVPGATDGEKAAAIGRPRITDASGVVRAVLVRAQVGAPFVARRLDYLFGSIIHPPVTSETGALLTRDQIDAGYWIAEPYTPNGEHPDKYYWSPHSRAVYAVQSGPIQIVWKRREPAPSTPPGADLAKYVLESGRYYRILTNGYVVSSSPDPRYRVKQIYWTESRFLREGKLVLVPPGRVGDVHIVHNSDVPQQVTVPYDRPEDLGIAPLGPGDRSPAELRTLWFDRIRGAIKAYNVEGRVLMELLGDLRGDGVSRESLGLEIVQLVREPNPSDVQIELGDPLTAFAPDAGLDDSELYPEEIMNTDGSTFVFRHATAGARRDRLYATRETRTENDLWVHWLEEGVAGLRWPKLTVRYALVWPDNVARYSHYVRPEAASDAEAATTAVPLPAANGGFIDWQDALPRTDAGEQLGAKKTPDQKFYTYLNQGNPAHRTLLRYMAKDVVLFERVFSWLGTSLARQQELEAGIAPEDLVPDSPFFGSVATQLSNWSDLSHLRFPNPAVSPRVVLETVDVGRRLNAPSGELGAVEGSVHWAAHLRTEAGTDYDPESYIDPFALGFDEARRGAIIPVNARPGRNRLEAWWFRSNGYDTRPGFSAVHWPSVIGRYTVRWPAAPKEIVLASNHGSGALMSLEQKGTLYVQNFRDRHGFNPNEEHALMLGGQAYALRDDLNVFGPDVDEDLYTSDPFVLLKYTAADGRPAMTPFKVLREKPEVGWTFEYGLEAGSIVQAPMPLPLLEKPLAPPVIGEGDRSLNLQIGYLAVNQPLPGAEFPHLTPLTTSEDHFFLTHQRLSLQRLNATDGRPLETAWYYVTAADYQAHTLTGIVSREEHLPVALDPVGDAVPPNARRHRFAPLTDAAPSGLEDGVRVVLVNPAARREWNATIRLQDSANGFIEVEFDTDTTPAMRAASLLIRPVDSAAPLAAGNWQLGSSMRSKLVSTPKLREFYSGFTLQDRKGNLWVYRGPHDDADPGRFRMQFYYRTMDGFFFPERGPDNQPPVGTITPYLRNELEPGSRLYLGDAVEGDAGTDGVGDRNPLWVTYKPVWPTDAPVLLQGESLALPKRGLPAIRGQSSLEIVYQQSQVRGLDGVSQPSVLLHDPTREKEFRLGDPDQSVILEEIPGSILTQAYRGKTYFPSLPPHLAERFFFDPNRGDRNEFSTFGALVLRGEFKDEALGEDYLLLNALSPNDVEALKALCPVTDSEHKGRWDAAIAGLATTVERFTESKAKPGTYIVDAAWDPDADGVPGREVGTSGLAEILDDDEAVDSYGLSAIGPAAGYVTLIAGNGLAFTPRDEPVSVLVMRVSERLYPGELKVIESPNPLAEKVTLQQVTDLAARATDEFEFEWRIASPVDGLPPLIYQNSRVALLPSAQTWNHVALPTPADRARDIAQSSPERVSSEVRQTVRAVSEIPFLADSIARDANLFTLTLAEPLAPVRVGGRVVLADAQGISFEGRTIALPGSGQLTVELSGSPDRIPAGFAPVRLDEGTAGNTPDSFVFKTFDVPRDATYSRLWLSLDLDAQLGAEVYLDGVRVVSANRGEDDTPTGNAPSGFQPLQRVYPLPAASFAGGSASPEDPTKIRHTIAVALYSDALPGVAQAFDLMLEAYEAVDVTGLRTDWLPRSAPDGVRMVLGETADVRSLSDNWVTMRYRPVVPANATWSRWTEPQLVEGYIKRVLKGINPFNQRVKNLFENRVNTDASILTQAGPRYEGDIALNLNQINSYGLIEIYETVLRRGRMLSIDAGINFPGANDALLLAAGYLNDLYMMLGNEASADAANPTIGIGTKDRTYGDVATAMFSFKGQVPSLLEEELALLRGRDDFLPPGTEVSPVYNRLIWNYTRGIDSGEVVYALNYNILEDQDDGVNGVVDADDARRMYPQGHGDAYGHYLTALKGYYSLFMDTDFDWVPRTESVLILGKPVQVDYSDERKFAAAAVAVARAGRQVYDLSWRQNYLPGDDNGWDHFASTRSNTRKALPTTRYWGQDHWASRTMGGAYLNWVMGNALLPDEDPDPEHEGIQRIDRRTVPELRELVTTATDLQTASDNAEAHLSPLGLPAQALAFDLNPNQAVGPDAATHFEQVYTRAAAALRNAVVAFDDAKDVTRLMRSETDSLADFQTQVAAQERAYQTRLVELYGTPYPDDVGPGKTYATGYEGEDFLHFMYVDIAERNFPGLPEGYGFPADQPLTFDFDYADWPDSYNASFYGDSVPVLDSGIVRMELPPHGFFGKPAEWGSLRPTPGRIQAAIADVIKAKNRLTAQLTQTDGQRDTVEVAIDRLEDRIATQEKIWGRQKGVLAARTALNAVLAADELVRFATDHARDYLDTLGNASQETMGQHVIAGVASGANGKGGSVAVGAIQVVGKGALDVVGLISLTIAKTMEAAVESADIWVEFDNDKDAFELAVRDEISRIGVVELWALQTSLHDVNLRLQEYDDARRAYRGLLAEGNRIRDEREAYRQRAAAVIQGFRTRDAAFRIFRNEKLERYKSLFDLAARYSLLAANAYDYETGLLNTPEGRTFVQRIIASRALGVVKDGEPQFAGSNTGDPGLSSALAEMKADWDVLEGRLGFNNPDAYGTTASLRTENFRVLPGLEGDDAWKDLLQRGRTDNLLRDEDVLRHCLQIQRKDDLPVPGILLEFATTISDGLNLFGRQLAAGDHAFGSSSFATKIHAVGVALEGYQGMDLPGANTAAVQFAGGTSPTDPTLAFLDPRGLSATPYVYLIPVGLDSMRTPPLGDRSDVRTWSVDDVAIPLPFNIGASDFSTARLWQSSQSLSEPLFATRKHQSFRPVSTASLFTQDIFGSAGNLKPTQFTNRRLIGRSAWNSRWKLVIPGATLLNDPDQGLDRFIQTVRDIRLHFVTYSYSGN